MVRVYVRDRGELSGSLPPSRSEVKLDAIDGVSVETLLDAVAQQKNLDKQELHLMYGGRILQVGKSLDYYQIKDGSTLYLMSRRKKIKYASVPAGPEGMTVIFSSPAIQSEMAVFVKDPELVARMVPVGTTSEIKEVLDDPDLMLKMSDMVKINHHLRKNYLLFPVMKALLRLHSIKYSVRDTGHMDRLSMQVGEILGLASGAGSEQIVEPSEASVTQSGQQAMHGEVIPLGSDTSETGGEDEGGGGESLFSSLGVTPADLATALASIGTEQSMESDHSSTSIEPSQQPLSLPEIILSGSSAPASLQQGNLLSAPPPPPPPHPTSINRSVSDSGRGGSDGGSAGVVRQDGQSTGVASSSISALDLQNALSQAFTAVQGQVGMSPTSQSGSSSSGRHGRHSRRQHGRHSQRQQDLRERYTAHLEQLRAMGIRYNDSECLHALEAADGDLQTALDILMDDPGH